MKIQEKLNLLQKQQNFEYKILYYKTGSDSSIEFKCSFSHIFIRNWTETRDRNGKCPICSKQKVIENNKKNFIGNNYSQIKWNTESINKFMQKYEYKLLEEYKGANEKHKIQCDKGHQYEATWSKFRQGRRCPICSNNNRRKNSINNPSNGDFWDNDKMDKILPSHIKRVSTTDGANILVKFICNNKHIFSKTPSTIDQSRREDGSYCFCPICDKIRSFGEKLISQILDKNNIKYEVEYNFNKNKDLYTGNGSYYRFDFWIPEFNLAIEYDGDIHFRSKYLLRVGIKPRKNHNDGISKIEYRDEIKNKFCADNNINLLRISLLSNREKIKSLPNLIKNIKGVSCLI